jgi:hypothetical protein
MDDIDTIIATKIMGWVVHPRDTGNWVKSCDDQIGYKVMGSTCFPFKFSPSQNIDDAWQVIEHISTPGAGTRIDGLPWSTRFAYSFEKSNLWAFDAKGAALEISMMALRAAGIELESNAKDQTAGA